jgi:Zn-dependent M28 family amino/carboxypeptidase
VPQRSQGAVEAAKVGAVGALVRSVGTASYRLPHTGQMHYDEQVKKIPAAAITAEDADLISRLLKSGREVTMHFELGCEALDDVPSANVVADLPGREKPNEIVLIGAHLDSWDVGTGALDDGAGVAICIEALRLLKALEIKPRRTVRVVLFMNEENGLRGGTEYAHAHASELPSHVAAIESDSGAARPLGFQIQAGPGALDRLRELIPLVSAVGATDVREGHGGADIGPLRTGGVPMLGLRQDVTHYFDYHHTPADTLDKVDRKELAQNAATMAVMAYALAEMEGTLPRVAPNQPSGD